MDPPANFSRQPVKYAVPIASFSLPEPLKIQNFQGLGAPCLF
jgi:hypothetical protein